MVLFPYDIIIKPFLTIQFRGQVLVNNWPQQTPELRCARSLQVVSLSDKKPPFYTGQKPTCPSPTQPVLRHGLEGEIQNPRDSDFLKKHQLIRKATQNDRK